MTDFYKIVTLLALRCLMMLTFGVAVDKGRVPMDLVASKKDNELAFVTMFEKLHTLEKKYFSSMYFRN